MAVLTGADFSGQLELWYIYDALTGAGSGNGLLNEEQLFKVFNGNSPFGKAKSIFEKQTGLDIPLVDIEFYNLQSNNPFNATQYRSGNMTGAAGIAGQVIYVGEACVTGFNVINTNSYDIWFKLYNLAVAPNPAIDLPINKYQIPAGGSLIIDTTQQAKTLHAAGIAYNVTKFKADTDATPFATNDVEVFINYKQYYLPY